jgi:hypothetical protein
MRGHWRWETAGAIPLLTYELPRGLQARPAKAAGDTPILLIPLGFFQNGYHLKTRRKTMFDVHAARIDRVMWL